MSPTLVVAAVLDGDRSGYCGPSSGRGRRGRRCWACTCGRADTGFGDVRLAVLLGLFLGWLGW